MKVDSVFWIKGRGAVVCVTFAHTMTLPALPFVLRRGSDDRTWVVTGVERYCLRQNRPPQAREPVGFLVRGSAPPAEGDDVTVDIIAADATCIEGVDWDKWAALLGTERLDSESDAALRSRLAKMWKDHNDAILLEGQKLREK